MIVNGYEIAAGSDLRGADFRGFDLRRANLRWSDLGRANLGGTNLRGADLREADLRKVNFSGADLRRANLSDSNLECADLSDAYLSGAILGGANLKGAVGLVKIMGVVPGNYYYKRFDNGLINNGYQFKVGINQLADGEIFASDERELCSYPGFHFASKSWCDLHYGYLPLEALIRIPEDAQINEPWATDGKASADKIEIIKVIDMLTGKDDTEYYR